MSFSAFLDFAFGFEHKKAVVKMVQGLVEISLAKVRHSGPALQLEPFILKNFHSTLDLLLKSLSCDRHSLCWLVTWDRLHVRSEGKDQCHHKETRWLEAVVNVFDNRDWPVTSVKEVQGRDHIILIGFFCPFIQL